MRGVLGNLLSKLAGEEFGETISKLCNAAASGNGAAIGAILAGLGGGPLVAVVILLGGIALQLQNERNEKIKQEELFCQLKKQWAVCNENQQALFNQLSPFINHQDFFLARLPGYEKADLAKFVARAMKEELSELLPEELAEVDWDKITTDLEKNTEQVDALHDFVVDLHTRPPISILPLEDNEANRFIYTARRVTMRGRESELEELHGFLAHGDLFRWWAWVGLAGVGKSRLALELCRKLSDSEQSEEWEVGFYDWDVKRDIAWDKWRPATNTLIVFDYVQEHAEDIKNAIALLSKRQRELVYTVRFLLLERPAPTQSIGSWWETLLDAVHTTNAAHINGSCHGRDDQGAAQPRLLGGLEPWPVKEILAEFLKQANKEYDDAELNRQLAQIEQVDPMRRPLIVAFAAEAIEAGDMAPNWNAEDLTTYVLKRELARWTKALKQANENPKLWINLYLLTTMCSGLTIPEQRESVFDDAALRDWIPTIQQYGDGGTLALIAPGASDRSLPKLEPDMLGELFVLNAMKEWSPRDAVFPTAAWRHAPAGFSEFLMRAVNSFAQHKVLDTLLAPPTGDGAEDVNAWLLIRPLGLRCDRLGELGDTEAAAKATNKLFDLLRPLAKTNPRYAMIHNLLAKGLFNAIFHFGSNFERADQLLDELRNLHEAHSDDASVLEHLAKGLVRAFLHTESDLGRADQLLDELRSLCMEHTGDASVRELLAMGLANAIVGSGSDFERADLLLGELRGLSKKHPDDAKVREQLVHAYGASVHNSTAAGDGTRAAEMAEAIVPLRADMQRKPEIELEMRQKIADALTLAFKQGNGDVTQRIMVVFVELF